LSIRLCGAGLTVSRFDKALRVVYEVGVQRFEA